jgi:hypothetical protein
MEAEGGDIRLGIEKGVDAHLLEFFGVMLLLAIVPRRTVIQSLLVFNVALTPVLLVEYCFVPTKVELRTLPTLADSLRFEGTCRIGVSTRPHR